MNRKQLAVVCGVVATTVIGAGSIEASASSRHSNKVEFDLAAASPAIAACLPNAKAKVEVQLTTDAKGFDTFEIEGRGLFPNQAYTVFLLEQPGSPFGAAEYIGDFTTNGRGRGEGKFRLIVEEAFSSTIVGGNRVRAELNHVGFWTADATADDACFPGGGGPVTPFDGDNEAGAQVMNSANALPGAPLP